MTVRSRATTLLFPIFDICISFYLADINAKSVSKNENTLGDCRKTKEKSKNLRQ
jgi:hypothetical protein